MVKFGPLVIYLWVQMVKYSAVFFKSVLQIWFTDTAQILTSEQVPAAQSIQKSFSHFPLFCCKKGENDAKTCKRGKHCFYSLGNFLKTCFNHFQGDLHILSLTNCQQSTKLVQLKNQTSSKRQHLIDTCGTQILKSCLTPTPLLLSSPPPKPTKKSGTISVRSNDSFGKQPFHFSLEKS